MTIKERVDNMTKQEGVYICGDSSSPDSCVIIVSKEGKLYSTKIDTELSADRFLDSLTVSGPHKQPFVPTPH